MAKRKRGIFTVAEAVTNWFEASEPTELNPGRGENVDNWIDQDSAVASQSHVALRPSNWLDNSAGRDIQAEALPKGLDQISTQEPVDQLGVNPKGTNQLVDWLDGSWRLEGERTEAQGVARAPSAPGTGGYPANDTLPGNVEAETNESLIQAAFWQLLRDAGYDTW